MVNVIPLGPLCRGRNLFHSLQGFYIWYHDTYLKNDWKRAIASQGYGDEFWDRGMIQQMNDVSKNLHEFNRNGGTSYAALCFDGLTRQIISPKFDPTKEKLMIWPIGITDFAQNVNLKGKVISVKPEHLRSFSVRTCEKSRHELDRECFPQTGEMPWGKWKQEWRNGKSSSLSSRLKGLIHKHRERLKTVDQILCFALGPLQSNKRIFLDAARTQKLDKEFPKAFVQHMAAVTIR